MGIYDNIVFADVPDDLSLPFDAMGRASTAGESSHRLWQTKNLNPSMDAYLFREDGGTIVLYRRSPPIVKWTNENEGTIDDYEAYIDGADHWRQVRYDGTLTLTVAVGELVVTVESTLQNGVATQFTVTEPAVLESLIPSNTVLLTSEALFNQPCVWDNSETGTGILRFIDPSEEHRQIQMRLANVQPFIAALKRSDDDQPTEIAPSGRIVRTTAEERRPCVVCTNPIAVGQQCIRLSHDPLAPDKTVLGLHLSCQNDLSAALETIWAEHTPELLTDAL